MIKLVGDTFIDDLDARATLANFILRSPILSMGDKCAEFELAFAQWQGREQAVLFNSGASANLALIQAALNLGILKLGNIVGVSAVTWPTNVMPLMQLGLRPVPVDITLDYLNVTSKDLEHVLDHLNLAAFFGTNLMGFAGDLAAIRDVCRAHGVLFLEDNCESLGSKVGDVLTGNFGFAATFSFYIAHHITTIEGGMVCTDDKDFADMLRVVRANGWDRNLDEQSKHSYRDKHHIMSEFASKFMFYDMAYNLRPTEITGVLGLHQLAHLDECIKTRRINYGHIMSVLSYNSDFMVPSFAHMSQLSPFAVPLVCPDPVTRSKYLRRLEDCGVETRPFVGGNIQRQPFYRKWALGFHEHTPGADRLHDCAFYCSCGPHLTEGDIATIIGALRQ